MAQESFVRQMSGAGTALLSGIGGFLDGWRQRPADRLLPDAATQPDPLHCTSPFRRERLLSLRDLSPASLVTLSGWSTDAAGTGRPLCCRGGDGVEPRLALRAHRVVLQRAVELAGWCADHADDDLVLCHLPAASLADETVTASIDELSGLPPVTRPSLAVLVPAEEAAIERIAAMPDAWCQMVGLSIEAPDELERLGRVLALKMAVVEIGRGSLRALATSGDLGCRVIRRLADAGTPVIAAGIAGSTDLANALAIGISAGRGPYLTSSLIAAG